ncbi:MAG: protein-glutamine glutaminase family protein [Gemmataceae bacterium]
MAHRPFLCALTALALCLAAATVRPAPSATTTPSLKSRYSVFSRKPGTVAWSEHCSSQTMAEATAAARRLHDSGLEVQIHSWTTMPHVGAPPKTGPLAVEETVTARQAAQLFRWLAGQRDIAFGFPSDGCYARTHLMIRRLQERGYKPCKVWAFQNGAPLHVATANHPDGYVEWGYHIAPVLRVRFEDGKQRWYVIDPALFRAPVTIAQWRDAQKKPGSRWVPYVTLTRLGQAPRDPHGMQFPGSGYWLGVDPREGLDAHAVKVMRLFKPLEGHRQPRPLVADSGLEGERQRHLWSAWSAHGSRTLEQIAGAERDGLVAPIWTGRGRSPSWGMPVRGLFPSTNFSL